jgi:membrane associated rhomboid family serine protease
MARRGGALDEVLTLGGRVPPAVGGVVVAIVGVSLLGALTGLGRYLLLQPGLVLEGEVWRLATWTFVSLDPLGILFAGLTLFWFGRDLASAWGPRRFLAVWFGLGAASGLGAILLALAFPRLGGLWMGPWAVITGLLVAWGTLFPERQMLIWFALPLSGRGLVWITVGATLFFAAFSGLGAYLPELCGEALMLAWLRGLSPRGAWQRFRIWLGARRLRRRAGHLHVAKGGKNDPPQWLN